MLETVDLNKTIARSRYDREFPRLKERLRQLQYELKNAEVATLVLLEGWDAAGKSSVIQRMTQSLDPRAFRQHPAAPPSELEKRYHFLWRYQVRLPEDGQMAFFDHSWYSRVLVERVEKFAKKKEWQAAYGQIDEFERWLADDGQVIVKLFLHISKKQQKRRFERMEKDPAEAWKVTKEDWRRNRDYDKWVEAIEDMLAKTDTPHAPWTIVEAEDFRFARVKAFEAVVARMEEALKRRQAAPAAVSRTQLAKAATEGERAKRAQEESALVRSVASEAGLPLEQERR
jgi:polyphosphate kinase 2 (PPK2 family)